MREDELLDETTPYNIERNLAEYIREVKSKVNELGKRVKRLETKIEGLEIKVRWMWKKLGLNA